MTLPIFSIQPHLQPQLMGYKSGISVDGGLDDSADVGLSAGLTVCQRLHEAIVADPRNFGSIFTCS